MRKTRGWPLFGVHFLFCFLMRVKLVQGKLVVEEDKDDFMNIITPNGHTTKRAWHTVPDHFFDTKISTICGELQNVPKLPPMTKTIVKSSSFAKYAYCAFTKYDDETGITGWFDFGLQIWHRVWKPITESMENLVEIIELNMIEFILKFDRECENARNLHVIARFCEHLIERPDVLDVFSNVKKEKV